MKLFYYTPRKEVWGVHWFQPVRLSVWLSVNHLWTWFCPSMFLKMGAWIFWKSVHWLYSPSEDVHLEFSYWLDIFFTAFFLFLYWVVYFFRRRKTCSVLKLKKCVVFVLNLYIYYYDLQYFERAVLIKLGGGGWVFIQTPLIYSILK